MTGLSASFFALQVALWAQIAAAATIGPVGELVISNATVTLDGSSRAAVLAGNTFPGTLVSGNKGDNFLFVIFRHGLCIPC
jgi:iron transport multicopper oxidase